MASPATEHYQAGRLNAAVDAALAAVRSKPTDAPARSLLAQLLVFQGELQRADQQLDTLMSQDPAVATAVVQMRHVLHAEQARIDFYTAGRPPELLAEATEDISLRLKASIAIREGDAKGAAAILAEAESKRPALAAVVDGVAVPDLRDLDDLVGPILEVLTTTGKYFWVPMSLVESLEFDKPTRPMDLLFRPAKLSTRTGTDGRVAIPALYPLSFKNADDRVRLGRHTDFSADAPVRGQGLRMFLAGDDAKTMLEITTIAVGE